MWTSHFDNSEAEMNNDNDEPPEFVQIKRCVVTYFSDFVLVETE